MSCKGLLNIINLIVNTKYQFFLFLIDSTSLARAARSPVYNGIDSLTNNIWTLCWLIFLSFYFIFSSFLKIIKALTSGPSIKFNIFNKYLQPPFFHSSCFRSPEISDSMNSMFTSSFICGIGKLIDWWRNFEPSLKNRLLPLNPYVIWPFHKTTKIPLTTFFGAMMTKNETINQINEDVNANNRKRNGMNETRRDYGSRRKFGNCDCLFLFV
ncbi:hypothetical protein AGLY_001119 [Aphis glycines]|uniref:Uncharacterized protein n=1 Tax=Aphis glycines TaxID=307491 RepID=A0A6G0UBE0_APHGL|nr:hypothetical protein AGLY_001119 [Aphis glycines]